MKARLLSLFTSLTALLLGVLITFAFAPYEIFPLAVVAPAGLLACLIGASPKRAFWLGYRFGLGMFGAGTYWVYISINLYGNIPGLIAGFITAGFVGIMAFYPAAVCYLTKRFFPRSHSILAFPALWVLSEWLRSWLFTGFPWLFIGYSQTNSPLKGYAPILSVYGVSLAVLLTSSLLFSAAIQFKRARYGSLYLNLFFAVVIWILGSALTLPAWTKASGATIPISLVQGNIQQEIKWSPEYLQYSLQRYDQLTKSLWGKEKMIIWPEAAIPLPLNEAGEFIEILDKKAKATGSNLILGIPIQSTDGTGYYNALVTLGQTKQVYLKRRLVPFGEYVPFYNYLSTYFNEFNIPVANTVPGKLTQDTLRFGDVKILAAICYEIAFPELVNSKDASIGALLTVTNDAWFGDSAAQAQHLQMAAMRALELRRPVIFVSNNGITALIGADGNVQAAIPAHRTLVLNTQVQPMIGLTPWMQYGMDPILCILFFCLIAASLAQRTKKHHTDTTLIENPANSVL